MLSFLIFVLVWVCGAVMLHWKRSDYYKKNPHMRDRNEGLVSFSESQMWWIYTLWPLSMVALITYLIVILVCAIVEWGIEWKERRNG